MHWIFSTFFVKFSLLKLSFLTKPTFPKFCASFNKSQFQAKITSFLQLVLLVLNKFIEINTLIKRNLNFKYEVKSHKVRLQAYCSKHLLKWSYLYLSICQPHGCMIMTWLVPSERWELDYSPRGVPAADIWWPYPHQKWIYYYLSKSGYYLPMTSLPIWDW